jgi:hypothetical protein
VKSTVHIVSNPSGDRYSNGSFAKAIAVLPQIVLKPNQHMNYRIIIRLSNGSMGY